MGTMLVTWHGAGQNGAGGEQPVARLSGSKTDRVTTSAVSAGPATTGQGQTSRKTDGGFVTVTAVGVNLWVVAGTAPVAAYPAAGAQGNGFPVMSGQAITFGINRGDKVAAVEFT